MDALPPIAVMDGACTLCSFGAKLVHRFDRIGDIRICQIQTEMGQKLLRDNGLDAFDPESWLFIEGENVFRDFDALIRIGERSGGWARVLMMFRLIPSPLRKRLYRVVAKNRYKVFGRREMCTIPDRKLQERMIS